VSRCSRASGTAWRSKHKEYVYRSAAIWCSPEMVARVPGLPVIAVHPDKGTLDGRSFYERIVGICNLKYLLLPNCVGEGNRSSATALATSSSVATCSADMACLKPTGAGPKQGELIGVHSP
jgi:hypothetical protein